MYKCEGDAGKGGIKVTVYISFGGLLMRLVGDPAKLKVLDVDSCVYLLMRKL